MLQKAISERQIVSFVYYYNKGETRKEVDPYTIVFKWSAWYLFGYSVEKHDFRLFKLNRLWDLKLTDKYYELREIPPSRKDFNIFLTEEFNLVAIFEPSVKYRLIEEYGTDCFIETEDHQLLFNISFTSKDNILEWILSFGDKVEVVEPYEIREEICRRLKKSLKEYLKQDI